jgi:hypothetical protein
VLVSVERGRRDQAEEATTSNIEKPRPAMRGRCDQQRKERGETGRRVRKARCKKGLREGTSTRNMVGQEEGAAS